MKIKAGVILLLISYIILISILFGMDKLNQIEIISKYEALKIEYLSDDVFTFEESIERANEIDELIRSKDSPEEIEMLNHIKFCYHVLYEIEADSYDNSGTLFVDSYFLLSYSDIVHNYIRREYNYKGERITFNDKRVFKE